MRHATSTKRTIAVLFGGRSGEHEVSLMSARSVLSVLDRARFDIIEVGITHQGAWLTGEHALAAFEKGIFPHCVLLRCILTLRGLVCMLFVT